MPKKATIILCVILLFVILTSGPIAGTNHPLNTGDHGEEPTVMKMLTTSYIPHDPIEITCDVDFETQGWPGSGNVSDPYLIEDLNITSMDVAINITNTSVYFEIRNCLISSPEASSNEGIVLNNVTHAKIYDSTIEWHSDGIVVEDSNNCILTNNTFVNNNVRGVSILNSPYCTLTENVIIGYQYNSEYYILHSPYSILTNNTVSGSSYAIGFRVRYSEHSILTDNTAFYNHIGFYIDYSENVTLTNNNATFNYADGFNLQQSPESNLTNNIAIRNSESGFYIKNSGYCELKNNLADGHGSYSNAYYGFYLEESHKCNLEGNNATNNKRGFHFKESLNCILKNSTITESSISGVHLYESKSFDVQNNIIIQSGLVIEGTQLEHWTHTIENNEVNDKPMKYFYDLMGDDIDALDYGQVILANSKDVTIRDGDFTHVSIGIQVGFSENCTLINNRASNNSLYGFHLYTTDSCTIEENMALYNTKHGFHAYFSDYLNTTGNTASENGQFGFYVRSSNKSSLINNFATGNSYGGFYGSLSNHLHLSENIATNNVQHGFSFINSADCVVSNNTAASNSDHGFRFQGMTRASLTDNTIIGNSLAGVYLYSSGGTTLTDNTLTGNGIVFEAMSASQCFHDMSGNTVNDKPLGYFTNLTSGTIEGSLYGQVILANCSDVTVENGVFSNASIGMTLLFSSDCELTNNTSSDNSYHGFYSHWSDEIILTNNTATSNLQQGFLHWRSSNGTLTNNMATDNSKYGFLISMSADSILTDNTAMGNSYDGFRILSSNDCPLSNNTAISNLQNGFFVMGSSGCVLEENTATGNYHGFVLRQLSGNNLTSNMVASNSVYGIYLSESTNSILTDNTLEYNGVAIYGTNPSYWSHSMSGNTVNGKPLGYFANLTSGIIDGDSYGQVILAACSGVTVRNGIFTNASIGIQLGHSDSCTLTGNAANNNYYGFYLYSSGSSTISDNTATSSAQHGFYLYSSGSSTISDNTATSNLKKGFHLQNSDQYDMTGNTASNNSESGFFIQYSNEGTMTNNTASSNCEYGIHVSSSSTENAFYQNRMFYNNQSNAWDDGNLNSWDDNVSLGNCWGDYDGTGVYSINGTAESVDNYPSKCIPMIDSPDDLHYEAGTTGYTITWTPTDELPDQYEVYRNGSLIDSGEWDGSPISIGVDGLDVGTYNYTLVVYDTSGNWVSDTVFVTVVDTTPPTIDSPEDIEYEFGTTGHNITWTSTEDYPDQYEVYRNGSLIDSGEWDGSPISIGVDGLDVGTYNYTLVVYDTSGNWVSDTVFVTVVESVTTTPTETQTTTTTTTSPTTEPDILPVPWELALLLIATVGGIVVIIVVGTHLRKRS